MTTVGSSPAQAAGTEQKKALFILFFCPLFSRNAGSLPTDHGLPSDNTEVLLDGGTLLLDFGSLTRARECFERVRTLTPNDIRPVVNLANQARDGENHSESRRLYTLAERTPAQSSSLTLTYAESRLRHITDILTR